MKFRYFSFVIIFSILFIFSGNSYSQISLGGELQDIDYTNPKEYIIGGITVTGAKFLDNEVLIRISGLSVAQKIKIPGDKISEAINKLWRQGFFESISISATGIHDKLIFLNINLVERPVLSKFSFSGIRKTEADNIRDEIKLIRGDVVTENLINRTENIIKKHYKDKGFLNVDVNIYQKPDPKKANSVILDINIKKNSKIKIYKINIHGNKHLSANEIKKVLKNTKEKNKFSPYENLDSLLLNCFKSIYHLQFDSIYYYVSKYVADEYKLNIFKSSKYIKADYKEDKIELIKKYNELGYRDAKIVKDSIYRNDDKTINIDITVDEGKKYFFRDIKWVGNTKYSVEVLNKILNIKKGDVYNQDLLNKNLQFNQNSIDVMSLYMDDGYLFFSVQPIEVLVENDSIDLEIRIHEGKQATINKVSVKGNERTNDNVVIREIRSKPGHLFSRKDIIRTVRELAQLKYFDAEKITPDVQPNPVDGTVDIIYNVEEASSDQIELSGGWGYNRLIGTLGLSFNNFSLRKVFDKHAWRPIPSGDGQKVSVRLQSYGSGYISYSASFTEPWLGGKKPNAFSVSYYHSLFSNGYSKDNPNRSSFKIDGFTIGLGKRLSWPDDFFTLYQSVGLQRYSLDNYLNLFSFGEGNGNYNNINYSFALSRNSIDAPIYPRSGSEVSLSLKLTPPYSLFSNKDYTTMSDDEKYKFIEFHEWKIKANWYTKIIGDLVMSVRTRYGFLGCYNQDIGVTPFNRYFLGGDGLSGYNNIDGRELVGMRGYSNESLTPNYYLTHNVGGTIYNKSTFELRYPLSLNPSATIYVATFFEAGNSWLKFKEFNPFNLYRSAGVGIRVFLPMFGVLGLDWGYGFDDVPGLPDANGSQFHFSINNSIE